MVRPLGFFLALFKGSFKGELGAESGCVLSISLVVAGLRMVGKFMSRVNFFRFLGASCNIGGSCILAAGCLPSLGRSIDWPSLIIMVANGVEGANEVADSGEEDEESEISGESNVKFVVVGEDSVDSDWVNKDVTLPR